MKIEDGHNQSIDHLKNSHVIIFDIHSEYQSAFSLSENEHFKQRKEELISKKYMEQQAVTIMYTARTIYPSIRSFAFTFVSSRRRITFAG